MNLVKIGDIAKVFNGYAFESSKYTDSGYQVIRIANVQDGYITNDNPKFVQLKNGLERFTLDEGDLLISLTGNVGRVGRISNDNLPAVLNQRVGKLMLQENKVIPEFLYYFFRNKDTVKRLINKGKGIAQKNIGTQDIEGLDIYLPSKTEQIQIAKILDQADSLRQKRKQAIDLLDEYLKSIFLEMFGDPVTNPKGWDIRELSELVSLECPLTYGIVQPGNEYENGVYIVRPVDLVEDIISNKGLKRIDPAIDKKFKRTKLKGGELLLSVRGTTGVISIASNELEGANVTRGITPIWFSDKFNSLFAFHQIKSVGVQRAIQKKTYGIALKQINLSDVRKLKLINPPLELQNKFAKIVENTIALKQKMSEQTYELDNQFNALMQKHFNSN